MADLSSKMNDGSWKREGQPEMVVQPDSAKLFWPREKSIPCHFDHSQTAKLKRGESGIYSSISWSIKCALEEQRTLNLSQFQVSDHNTSEDSTRIQCNDLESDPSCSFGGAGNSTSNNGKKSSTATAAKSPDMISPNQLCAAIRDRNMRKMQESLARGCSVHSVNIENHFMPPGAYPKEGTDPYLLAAFLRQEMTLRSLIEHGADPFRTGPFKMTALHAVIFGEGRSMDPPTESIVALLLQHDYPLEQGDDLSRTPLMYSVAFGYLKSTQMLLDRGANVHACDEHQYTTLHHAVLGKNPDIVGLLINKGAKIDGCSLWNGAETALHSACRDSSSSSAQIVKMLLDAGADKDEIVNYFGEPKTPLHLAAGIGNADVINLLLAFGASIEAQTLRGYRAFHAIHVAFENGHSLAFRTLLDHGASVSKYKEFLDPTGKRFNFASKVSTKDKEDCVFLLKRADEQGNLGRLNNVRI